VTSRRGPAAGTTGPEFLGTRLQHLLDVFDRDLGAIYADLGLAHVRPRYVAYIRTIAATGPRSIRDLAAAVGVTHSAASQTVAQMSRQGLVTLTPGTDARHRIVGLTAEAERLLPTLDAEWAATAAAATALEAELSMPLSALVTEVFEALERRPMRARIADTGLLPA
jgi:DNA-binding MarR family transcriptional regulator